jgi:uncharacterized repeat protein (TIGR01451 family)
VTIRVQPTAAGTLTNTATVAGDQPDPDTSNNSTTATTTVLGDADVSLTVSASPSPASVGGPIAYGLAVTNAGPARASGVTVTDTLPPNVQYRSSSGTPGCTQAGSVVTCHFDRVSPGTTVYGGINVTATSKNPATTNSATVAADQPDPDVSNNTASVTIAVLQVSASAFGEQVRGVASSGPLPAVSATTPGFDYGELASVTVGAPPLLGTQLDARTLAVEVVVGFDATASSHASTAWAPIVGPVEAQGVQARCNGDQHGVTGSTSIAKLHFGLQTLADLAPSPNTRLPVPGGTLTLNEQSRSGAALTVNAMHLRTIQADIILSQAHCSVDP